MVQELLKKHPMIKEVIALKEVFWDNPIYKNFEEAIKNIGLGEAEVRDAEERLSRFAPYLKEAFPETAPDAGIIESPLVSISGMKSKMEKLFNTSIEGDLLLKCDSHLPISGSIKARGGIYEVLKHAEDLAVGNGMLSYNDDYSIMNNQSFTEFFSNYSIAVGSTGNLGLSIGIISAKLGFRVYVHMSADAKQWKKDLLRSKGVTVIEYESDYSKAVEEGRKQAEMDKNMYFVDDENSVNLFLGYAVAAYRLQKQLKTMNIIVDKDNPLFVYLPCGVGGGPGGVAFGLKLIFKDAVHCFFAEPTHSPCMLIGIMTGLHDKISVQDLGIDNRTDADGLAVGRASGFVGRTLENLISGCFTVEDTEMYKLLATLADSQGINLEPSAMAGFKGAVSLFNTQQGLEYLKKQGLESSMTRAHHIFWATGGSMVPGEVMKEYYGRGLELLS